MTLIAWGSTLPREWEEWTMDGEESWGYMLLNLIMTNTMTQWIGENTRFGGNEEASRLDLMFLKEMDVMKRHQG